MGKIKDWYNKNFYSSPTWDESEYEIPIQNSSLPKNDNEGAKLFLDAYDRTVKFPEKSYIFDKLDEIFMQQKEFAIQIDENYKQEQFNCYHFDKGEFDLYYDLNCAIEELVEAIRELNTKKWKQTKKNIDKEKILEEIVDSTKFLHQAVLRLGFNANDFYELHKKKSGINKDRQKNNY